MPILQSTSAAADVPIVLNAALAGAVHRVAVAAAAAAYLKSSVPHVANPTQVAALTAANAGADVCQYCWSQHSRQQPLLELRL